MMLSLVIPAFNEESIIGECLSHVANQTQQFDEVIVVDNASTDRTIEVAHEYADRLPLRIISEARQGVLWARETGFKAAAGDVIARIDADTRLERHWAARVRRHMSKQPDVAGILGLTYVYDTPASEINRRATTKQAMKLVRRRSAPNVSTLSGNNMAIRKSTWRDAQPFLLNAPGTHEDIDLSQAATKSSDGRFVFLASAIASASPRRMYSSLWSILQYRIAVVRTLIGHRDFRAAVAGIAITPPYLIWVLLFQLIAKPYDPQTGKWRPFRSPKPTRVSPVTVSV